MVKYIPIIQSTLFLIFVSSLSVMGGETPTWWKQMADEAKMGGYNLVTPAELKGLYDSGEDFLIVDVRAEYEYQQGHLPKAINLEFDLGDRLQLKPEKRNAFKQILGPDNNRNIIIYCRSFR